MQAAAIASVGLQVAGSLSSAQGKASAYRYAEGQAQARALDAKTSADQTDSYLRDELSTTLGNIATIRAAANIDPSSPTSQAIIARQEEISGRQRRIQVGNLLAQSDQSSRDAAYYSSAASSALGTGFINAFATGLKGFSGIRTA